MNKNINQVGHGRTSRCSYIYLIKKKKKIYPYSQTHPNFCLDGDPLSGDALSIFKFLSVMFLYFEIHA